MSRISRSAIRMVFVLFGLCGLVGEASAASKSGLRHFVAFKFKVTASPSQIDSVVAAFMSLKKSISEVQSIEAGPNESPEQLNKGFTHGFLVTFKNEKGRDVYLTHPAHEKFKSLALPLVEDAFVFDFVNGKTTETN